LDTSPTTSKENKNKNRQQGTDHLAFQNWLRNVCVQIEIELTE